MALALNSMSSTKEKEAFDISKILQIETIKHKQQKCLSSNELEVNICIVS